jgi:hypothetical protein
MKKEDKEKKKSGAIWHETHFSRHCTTRTSFTQFTYIIGFHASLSYLIKNKEQTIY